MTIYNEYINKIDGTTSNNNNKIEASIRSKREHINLHGYYI
jgi:hypothetical protein